MQIVYVIHILFKVYKIILHLKNIESNIINFDTLTKSFIENLLNFNFDIVKCYKLMLNIKHLLHNIGFLFLSLMLLLQIILLFIYLIKKQRHWNIFFLNLK